MSIGQEKRLELLRNIRFDSGQAERTSLQQSARGYLPVVDHLRALEPEVVLVVGDRGAGKSMLVKVALDSTFRDAVLRLCPSIRAPTGTVTWLRAWPLESAGPDPRGWRTFVNTHRVEPEAALEVWWAYLLRVVSERLDANAREKLKGLLSVQGGNIEQCHAEFRSAGQETLLALDRLDQQLADANQWVVVAYDELDTIVSEDPEAMRAAIRGLISFWVAYARRWHHLRAKIFIRTDFYRRFGNVAGADLAKLAASRVELTWSDRNLYSVLVKHFANAHPDLLDYAQKAKIRFEPEDSLFGYIPRLTAKDDARPFVERLLGRYMGTAKKKGLSFTWILEHLRDGNGKVSPRTLINLVELAAQREEEQARATGMQLIHPTALRQALDQVSEAHVASSFDEMGWMYGLKERLADKREVPWDKRELERLLKSRFEESWGAEGKDIRPPASDYRELLDVLVELGIIRPRSKDKYDVPDLYLKGLNLLRRGGVLRH